MKKVLNKTADILGWVVGYGLMISLFVGGLSFFGYVIAIIIGGEVAVKICDVIYKDIYPILVTVTSVLIVLGLIKMYIAGEKSLTPSSKKKELEKANKKAEQFIKQQAEQEIEHNEKLCEKDICCESDREETVDEIEDKSSNTENKSAQEQN